MKFRRPRFSMRVLLIAMLVLGTGLGFLGRRLIQIRSEADRQLEVIEELRKHGAAITVHERGAMRLFETLVHKIDGRTRFTRVSRVTLGKSPIEDKDIAQIAKLSGLEVFHDYYGHCTDESLAILANCSTLKEVQLSNWKGTAQGAKALLRGRAPIRQLTLFTVSVDDEFFAVAARAPHLELLWIEGAKVSANGIRELKASKSMSKLAIDHGRGLGSGLAILANHPTLQSVRLREYLFAEVDVADFAKLHGLNRLQIDCETFPQGVLQSIGSCHDLLELTLSGEFSGEESEFSLGCSKLEAITIKDSTPRPELLLRELAKLKHLKRIELPKTSLNREDLELLYGHPSLEHLSMKAAGAPVEAITRLQRQLRKCDVWIVYSDGRRYHYPSDGSAPKLVLPGL